MKDQEKSAKIIKDFLVHPKNRSVFNEYFKLICNISIKYLNYLRRRGFSLTSYNIKEDKNIENLVYDLLGFFLASKPGKPFFIIFEYFKKQGIVNFDDEDSMYLFDHFTRLLKSFIHQQLTKINKAENPQKENLKRRFKEILLDPEFEKIFYDDKESYFCLKAEFNNSRENLPYIDLEMLERIVLESFFTAKNRKDWCVSIFTKLANQNNVKNILNRSDLLRLVVKINYTFLYDLDNDLHLNNSIQSQLIQNAVKKAIDSTLIHISSGSIHSFLKKGRITDKQRNQLLTACRMLIMDYGANGAHDSFRTYLNEAIGSEMPLDEYQKNYNYICNSVFNNALTFFKNELKNNSVIQGFRDY